MDINKKVQGLNLPAGSYMVVGSGIMNVLGIRESEDIDLLVSEKTFSVIVSRGWRAETLKDGTIKLTDGVFDCVRDWYGKSFEEMINRAEYIDDLAYMRLNDVCEWKQALGRQKDIADLRLIEEYYLKAAN